MEHPLLRLSAADFDAFLERGSATRARTELKGRATTWARGVVGRLGELGTPVEASVVFAPAHGELNVFFWRNARARADVERLIDHKKTLAAALAGPATDHKHAHLGLVIDAAKVEVSFEVHPDAWVDARNLRARLAEPEGVLELTSALEALPEEFAIGLASGMLRRPAQEARAEQIRELVARSAQDATPFWVGWTVPRGVAVRHSAVLDELLEGAIVALGPVYELVAWAPDNDLLVVGREWEARAREAARHAPVQEEERERNPKRAHWTRRHQARMDEREPRTVKTRSQAPARESVPPALRLQTSSRDRPKIPHATRPAFRALTRRGTFMDLDPSAPIGKGARVRVLSGPFVGRVGTVQALDGKGYAKVLLGLLATRVALADLIATSDGPKALATSHRKPT
jgi:KOW motif